MGPCSTYDEEMKKLKERGGRQSFATRKDGENYGSGSQVRPYDPQLI